MKQPSNRTSAAAMRIRFPLTPTLSPSEGERENRLPACCSTGGCGLSDYHSRIMRRRLLFPLPLGGGEG